MTIKFDNIYIKDSVVGGGPFIKDGPIAKYLDFKYDDFLDGEKTYEDCEIKELERTINIIKDRNNIDLVISSDLSNQLMISNVVNKRIGLPYLGLYNACASFTEEIIVGSSLLKNRNIKNVLITTSSHNLTSERNFRYPTEYGSLKKEYQTFTVTSQTGMLLSKEKTDLKIEYCTIGRVMDYGIKDSNDMGSVMAPACAYTLYEHLKDTNRRIDDYDLILTGDLGKYGKEIFKELVKEEYGIKLKNYDDTACIIYNKEDKRVLAGGSGISCMPTYFLTKVIKDNKYKKILLLATGALFNTTLVNQKKAIPGICHAVSVVKE
ncbi:MAG: stage V sporulation protein AD [bacterium]|nr:stage V sporulation protein AD [bacterium]